MPVTPYHFGPSGFVGLVFRKWLDIPVFMLANVAVDVEVLIYSSWPIHRHAHTLLIGAVVGILLGIVAYPLRHLFKIVMRFLFLEYKTTFLKMVISGILGVWLHVLIDALYHWDVRIFWPSKVRPFIGLLTQQQVKYISLAFFVPAVILYIFIVVSNLKRRAAKENNKIVNDPNQQ